MPPNLKLPKISLDPSKIKDRWGLSALALIVWLWISYFVLSKLQPAPAIAVTVFVLTFLLLVTTLMLSFGRPETDIKDASPNLLPARRRSGSRQRPTAQELQHLDMLVDIYQDPDIQKLLKDKFKAG